MESPENIYNTTQNFLTPEFIQRFSDALDEPEDNIQRGLRLVIPTFLSGLIHKASTTQGAEEIVHLVEDEKFETTPPANLNDAGYLSRGEHAIDDIFDDYHSVANSLTPETGMGADRVERLMEMVAPVVLGVLGNQIRQGKMTPDHLSGFLQQQKKVLRGFIPASLAAKNRVPLAVKNSLPQSTSSAPEHVPPTAHYRKKKPPFGLIMGIVLFVFFLALRGFFSRTKTVETLTREISAIHKAQNDQSLSELSEFLQNGDAKDLPQTFRFQDLLFISGSTDRRAYGEAELDRTAEALIAYPSTQIRLQAYVEDTGDPEENLLLSENRAMLIREELIARGVAPFRIRVEGKGASQNKKQVELIVTKM